MVALEKNLTFVFCSGIYVNNSGDSELWAYTDGLPVSTA